MPTARSEELEGKSISLQEILARIPGLANLYRDTFKEKAKTHTFQLFLRGGATDTVDLRIDVDDQFEDRATLQRIVTRLREQ